MAVGSIAETRYEAEITQFLKISEANNDTWFEESIDIVMYLISSFCGIPNLRSSSKVGGAPVPGALVSLEACFGR